MIGQIAAAAVAVIFGIRIEDVPFLNDVELSETLSVIITMIWIVGITNAINLIDGLDGLSAGISVISAVS